MPSQQAQTQGAAPLSKGKWDTPEESTSTGCCGFGGKKDPNKQEPSFLSSEGVIT